MRIRVLELLLVASTVALPSACSHNGPDAASPRDTVPESNTGGGDPVGMPNGYGGTITSPGATTTGGTLGGTSPGAPMGGTYGASGTYGAGGMGAVGTGGFTSTPGVTGGMNATGGMSNYP